MAAQLGCGPTPDDDDCPADQVFVSPPAPDGCGETYCGAPTVRVGTTGTVVDEGGNQLTRYVPVDEGEDLPVWYGSQGGYHLDIALEMTNFCPIVFLRPWFKVVPDDGSEPFEAFSQNRHVQAVRVEPEVSPRQQFWGIRAFVPCQHWPDDPVYDLPCPEGRGSEGHLEDVEAIIGVEVHDHHVDEGGEPTRTAADSRLVDPYCCEYPSPPGPAISPAEWPPRVPPQ